MTSADQHLASRWGQEVGQVVVLLFAGALAVLAPWPTAGPTLAFLELLPGSANAAFSSGLLLRILDPADELVAGERRDVLPGIERRRVGDQRHAQVLWKLVHHPTGHSRAAHRAKVVAVRATAPEVPVEGRAGATTRPWRAPNIAGHDHQTRPYRRVARATDPAALGTRSATFGDRSDGTFWPGGRQDKSRTGGSHVLTTNGLPPRR